MSLREKALEAVTSGQPMKLDLHQALMVHAGALLEQGDHWTARPFAEAALAYQPAHPELQMMAAHLALAFGERQKAAEHAFRALNLDMEGPERAWHLMATAAPERVDLREVYQLIDAKPSADVRSMLWHTVAWYHDRVTGDRFEAFRAFELQNELRLTHDGPVDFHVEPGLGNRTLVEWAAEEVDWWGLTMSEEAQRARAAKKHKVLRVFIVGLPRSGTTLIEQALLSAPGSFSLGEDEGLGNIFAQLERYGPKRMVEAGDAYDAHALSRAAYLAERGWREPAAPSTIISKTTTNYAFIGLAALMWGPENLVVVDVRRDPRAILTSCWSQSFASSHLNWTCSWEALQEEHARYVRVRDAYKAMLAPHVAWAEAPYEKLVRDWNNGAAVEFYEQVYNRVPPVTGGHLAALLFPGKNSRPVRTASNVQVRRPVNTAAIDGWRRFEEWLPPEILKMEG